MAVPLRAVVLKPSKYTPDGSVERFRRGSYPTATVPYLRSMTPARVAATPVEVHAVDTGAGSDRVALKPAYSSSDYSGDGGGLSIHTAEGNDRIDLRVPFDTPTVVDSGDGIDGVYIDDGMVGGELEFPPYTRRTVDDLTVRTGNGNDVLVYRLSRPTVGGNSILDGGTGNDIIRVEVDTLGIPEDRGGGFRPDLYISGGEGKNEISLVALVPERGDFFLGTVVVDGGRGNWDSLAIIGFGEDDFEGGLVIQGVEILE